MKQPVFYKILLEIAKENGFKVRRVIDNVFELKKGNKKVLSYGIGKEGKNDYIFKAEV